MKRLLSFFFAAAMLLSLCACGAAGDSSNAGTTAAPSAAASFKAGYGKADITPQDSVPMNGYSSSSERMSTGILSYIYSIAVAVQDADGNMRSMCGVIPGEVRNTGKLARFGYVTLSPKSDGTIPAGTVVKGHEFHYWDSDNCGSDWEAVKTNGTRYECIHDNGSMIAGYPHLYYYSNPEVPYMFLQRCREYAGRRI